MRNQLLKLNKSRSTKSERIIGEILKRNRVRFIFKARINKYEVDFLIGKLIVEIDGSVHQHTNTAKDIYLASKGYVPVHISAKNQIRAVEETLLDLIKSNNERNR